MSGIAGILHLDTRPVEPGALERMTAAMAAPGGTPGRKWQAGCVALGWCDRTANMPPGRGAGLATAGTGGETDAIVLDGRIDNADEIAARLGTDPARDPAALVLDAHRAWGAEAFAALEGDFALILWDGRNRRLHAARDAFAQRPLVHAWLPGRMLALASTGAALLALPEVPRDLDEGRIADFLVGDAEARGSTITWHRAIRRLPPAHCLTASPGMAEAEPAIRRFWSLAPQEPLRLGSDDAYAEALMQVFSRAVARRLPADGSGGTMLSGGMDSGTATIAARAIAQGRGLGPLVTVSAHGASTDRTSHEAVAIRAAMALPGLDAREVRHDALDAIAATLVARRRAVAEPSEAHRDLLRAILLTARSAGLSTILGGGGGDVLFTEGSAMARDLRALRISRAWDHARGMSVYFQHSHSPASWLWPPLREAFVPGFVRDLRRAGVRRRHDAARLGASLIAPDFARRIDMPARLATLHGPDLPERMRLSFPEERARTIMTRDMAVGFEHYERQAVQAGLETADAFTDRQVVLFAAALPREQLLRRGWAKAILRHAMRDQLPAEVTGALGKQHFGPLFSRAVSMADRTALRDELAAARPRLAPYVDLDRLDALADAAFGRGAQLPLATSAAIHALWLWLDRQES